jgi:excisionase family DNA binding protein
LPIDKRRSKAIMPDSDDTLYTTEEVAGKLKITPKTVREYIQRGELEAIDMGQGYRIYKRDLDTFIEHRRRRRTERDK